MTTILSPAAPSDINPRSLGHAYGLSALVSIIPERPLYVSYDVSAKVLDMAIQLLKHSAEHDVKIAGIEVEVAWTLIASLMSLGPNFVRAHLQQLLVLWRNALPKPTSKDAVDNTTRPLEEWMFLFHLRESALGAILSFLKHNSTTLVTLDVGRRIAMVLSNALLFANNFINQKVDDGTDTQIPSPQPKRFDSKGKGSFAATACIRMFHRSGLLKYSRCYTNDSSPIGCDALRKCGRICRVVCSGSDSIIFGYLHLSLEQCRWICIRRNVY